MFFRSFCTKTREMVRILNVAEKNDAAKSLAELMSRGQYRRRDGLSRFNKIYEFEYNILGQQNVTMTMTSVSGHLLGLEFVGSYRGWRSCNPVSLFDAPVAKHCPEDYADIKRTLEREVRGCQQLIIWTDCDREGENIGYEIVDVCQAVKPNLRVHRARFSEITQHAVTRAVNNLIPPDKRVSDAVDVRQELDLRIGAAFTRFQTLRLQRVFPDVLKEQLISYGSCQFPTLGFVVERYKQVQDFVPEPFWKIKVCHETDEGEAVEFNWKRNRLFDHTACMVLYQHVTEDPIAHVLDVVSKPKSKWRPAALETVELEKLASRKLRINAKETMKIAEKLYTQGLISYPRTETNIFPKELDLNTLVQNQTQDANWGGFAAGILENGGPTPRNGNKTDQAHPPIHPTKYTNTLQGNEQRVYEFVVRHFLACCSADAQGQETTVDIDINGERFAASGLMIIARNYLDVYPYDRWNAKVIPVFYPDEEFQPKLIEMTQGETSAPGLLTEADLIALMDKHGIGTDATHAEHIETIKSRLYVGVRDDGRFVPGELGMGLVEGYDAMGYEMSKPNLRSELEADLKRICDGQKNKDEVLQAQVQKYREVFVVAQQQADKIDAALSQFFGNAAAVTEAELAPQVSATVRKCPMCGNADMVIKTKKDGNGLYMSCMGYPDCRNAIWLPDTVLQAETTDQYCDNCRPEEVRKIAFKFKKGSVPIYMPTSYVGCLSCDTELKEILDLKGMGPRTNNTGSQNRPPQGYQQSSSSSQRKPSVNKHSRTNSFNNDSGYNTGPSQTSFSSRSQSQTPGIMNSRTTNSRGARGGGGGSGRGGTGASGGGTRGRGGGSSFGQGGSRSSGTGSSFGQNAAGNSRSGGSAGAPGGAEEKVVVCSCDEDAKLLTVRKEGANQGRQFYTCAKPQDSADKCKFFLWADEEPEDGGGGDRGGGGGGGGFGGGGGYGSNTTNRGGGRQSFGGGGGGDAGDVLCKCATPARQLTVNKEGPNKGRPFYGCSKPPGQGCGFFQWGDEEPSGGGGGGASWQGRGGSSSSRGRGTGGAGGGVKRKSAGAASDPGAKRKRRCGMCGEEGHTKKTCPLGK